MFQRLCLSIAFLVTANAVRIVTADEIKLPESFSVGPSSAPLDGPEGCRIYMSRGSTPEDDYRFKVFLSTGGGKPAHLWLANATDGSYRLHFFIHNGDLVPAFGGIYRTTIASGA
jgi:hypothetical protein